MLGGLLNMLFPKLCTVCGRPLVEGEDVMCLQCALNLPVTNLHLQDFNEIHHKTVWPARIQRAAAYFRYVRGNPYTRLIHVAKYAGRPQIAEYLATQYATLLMAEGFFNDIDFLIPVPMHKFKKWRRGYNQAEVIARAISRVCGVPVSGNLVALHAHSTQTRLSATDRHLNAVDIYGVDKPHQLAGKHVMIVDDVITTGATLSECCTQIHKACHGVKISVLALASAR